MNLMRVAGMATAGLLAAALVPVASPAAAVADATTRDCRGVDVPVATATVRGTVHGTLCTPAGRTPKTVMVLVPGATYNSVYWDFPYQPQTYSYSRAMVEGGYATFAIDPLGTGRSSRPASVLLTSFVQADAVHDVIQSLRPTFDHVVLTGHSLGSAVAVLEAATYHDVDALVVTGLQHRVNLLTLTKLFTTEFGPAPLDPVLKDQGYDLGQLTTKPGRRYESFYSPGDADPAVVAVDEATKDAFAVAGAPDAVGIEILTTYSASIDVPVFIAMGQYDSAFCGFLVMSCSQAGVLRTERPYYAAAPSVDAFVLPGSGHDLNLNPRAPRFQAAVVGWVDGLSLG
ncbi:alpha/beta hydrolase [Kribbella sp. NPDC051620]|uniref:alpha/beta hydrolase n=1 Tax=Kribbella sp. NPDC051620 TaxID=3364120 RepID=UPI00379E2C3B